MRLLLALLFSWPASAVTLEGEPAPVPELPPQRVELLTSNSLAFAALASARPDELNLFGVPGPGVTPEHVMALQAVADQLKTPLFVHGSRQLGVRKTGESWGADSDLDLGVIGEARDFLRAAGEKRRLLGVPDVKEVPTFVRDSIGDALKDGYLVVAPSRRAQDRFSRTERERHLETLAKPFRTDAQLERLAASPRAPGEKFTFAVIGDAEPGRFWLARTLWGSPGVFREQLESAERKGADFIMQLGDMVSRGTVGFFTRFLETLARAALRTPFLTVIGNHDRHKPHGVTHDRVYRSVFGKTDYYFDRGGYRFVALDSSARRVTREQLVWLERALDTDKRAIVFTHMMPAAIRSATAAGGAFALGGFVEGSAEFAAIVARHDVERVYLGHVHALGVRDYLGVRYVLTGGGGSPLYPTVSPRNAFHHYLTVEAGPDGLTETVRLPDGSSFPL